jgi:hypothetical protein
MFATLVFLLLLDGHRERPDRPDSKEFFDRKISGPKQEIPKTMKVSTILSNV